MSVVETLSMVDVVNWVRGRGRIVLLDEGGSYLVDNRLSCDAAQFLRWANVSRRIEGLAPFPAELAMPRHRRRKGHIGSLNVLSQP